MNIKGALVVFGSAIAGNFAAEKFLLKDPTDPNDKGLVEVQPGFGMDDVVRALAITVVVLVGQAVLGRKKG